VLFDNRLDSRPNVNSAMLSFFLAAVSALVLAPGSAFASEFVQNAPFSAQMYESGAVMDQIMATKMVVMHSDKIGLLAECLLIFPGF
jgi:hypothetical protein